MKSAAYFVLLVAVMAYHAFAVLVAGKHAARDFLEEEV